MPAPETERLESVRDSIDEQQRGRLRVHVAAVQVPTVPMAPAAPAARPVRPRFRIAALVSVVALVVAAGAGSGSGSHVAASHDPFPRLHLETTPSQERWPDADEACERERVWTKRFDDHYRGDVYVQLTSGSAGGPVSADLTLTWGNRHWQGFAISVLPGELAKRQGGILLLFVEEAERRLDPLIGIPRCGSTRPRRCARSSVPPAPARSLFRRGCWRRPAGRRCQRAVKGSLKFSLQTRHLDTRQTVGLAKDVLMARPSKVP